MEGTDVRKKEAERRLVSQEGHTNRLKTSGQGPPLPSPIGIASS